MAATSASKDRRSSRKAEKLRGARKVSKSLALMGTAVALTVGAGVAAPTAFAADPLPVDGDVITTGPLFALLAQLGLNTLGPLVTTANLGAISLPVSLTLALTNVKPEPADLSNSTNSIATFGNTISILANDGTRGIIDLGIGTATPDLLDAYRGMLQGINANGGNVPSWPTGFTAWTPGTGPGDGNSIAEACTDPANCRHDTFATFGLIRDTSRPNGGLLTRFPLLASLFGVDTTLPDTGMVANGKTTDPLDPANWTSTERLYSSILDLTWEYDPLADFPVTLNPFSLLNTVMATLPLNALTGISNFKPVFGTLLNAALPAVGGLALNNGTYFSTLQTYGLPIMELLRLPVQLINLATGLKLPTPIANILEPMMKILVNTGYSDVLTPDELNNCAQNCGTATEKTWAQLGYNAYDRALTQGGQTGVLNGSGANADPAWVKNSVQGETQDTVRFLSEQPLTFEQWLSVPGDLVNAFFVGLNQAFDAPQPIIPAGALASSAAATAAAVAAPRVAAARVASPAAAVDTADESTPAEPATLSVSDTANDSAPVAATPKPRPTAAHSGAREAGAKAGSAHGGAVSAAAAKPRAGARG